MRIEHGLDASWIAGLNIAVNQGMQFGKEIIFTYGPLGFLFLPKLFTVELWYLSLSFHLAVHGFFFYALYLLLKHHHAAFFDSLFLCLSTVFAYPFLGNDYKGLLSISIILFLIMSNKLPTRLQTFHIIVCLFFLAVLSLVKFSAAIIAINILTVFVLYLFYGRQFVRAAAGFAGFFIFLCGLWVLAGQNPGNFYDYLILSYNLSTSYNGSMQTEGPLWQLCFALIVILFLVGIGTSAIRRKMKDVLYFFALNGGLIFFSFKHGFVRHQTHACVFFSTLLLFLAILYVIQKKNFSTAALRFYPVFALFTMLILFQNPHISIFRPIENLSQAKEYLYVSAGTENCRKAIADSKTILQNQMPFEPRFLESQKNKTIDIIPWDTSLVFAYDLNWSPRPIFHSYAASSKQLDDINAAHFKKPDAPEMVWYAFKSIDDRYPVFDEPAVFRVLLSDYEALLPSKDAVVLKRKAQISDDALIFLSESRFALGEEVKVPSYDHGYTFAKIDVRLNMPGKIIQFLYKPSKLSITFVTDDGKVSPQFRFVAGNAGNGVFLSQYLRHGVNDLIALFAGEMDNDRIIRTIQIDADHQWQFQKESKIAFFGMPVKPADLSSAISNRQNER